MERNLQALSRETFDLVAISGSIRPVPDSTNNFINPYLWNRVDTGGPFRDIIAYHEMRSKVQLGNM